MTPTPNQPETPVAIRAKLNLLRSSIRRYVWIYGIAGLLCAVGVAFWGSLVIDWFFEPPVWVRVIMQLTVAGVVATLFYTMVLNRLRRPLTDANMALLLERRFPELQDHLLTVIDPDSETTPAESEVATFLYQQATRQATTTVAAVDVRNVFDYTLLRRSVITAGILWLLIVIFTVLFPGVTHIWAARGLGLSGDLWPRQTRLELVGVQGNRMKVARGADLEITVGADLTMPRVPQTVRIQRDTSRGIQETKTMTREGEGVPGKDPHQLFTHTFHAIREPFALTVRGGDANLGPVQVEVVESPTVETMTLRCRFPDYMARKPRDLSVIGPMEIPRGTHVTILGRSAKPLTRVEVERIGTVKTPKGSGDTKQADAVTLDPNDPRRFRCELAALTDSQNYRFTLHDTDGIKGRDPFLLTLSAVDDEPPEVPDELYGIGSVVTPNAYLPVRGTAVDDYGIARVWFDYTINPERKGEANTSGGTEPTIGPGPSTGPQGPEQHGRQVIFETEGNPTELTLNAALDLEPLGLKPDQKIAVTLSAADRCTLNGKPIVGPGPKNVDYGPNVGSGRRHLLEIVPPQRLMILLQARELILRQRFEAILTEVNDTREILVRLDFTQPKKESQQLQDELAVRRAVENCRKNAEETRAVAEAFDDIRLQMIHNRIDSSETNARLATGIVAPLQEVVDRRFPELEREIEPLLTTLVDPDQGPKQRDQAVGRLDSLLEMMNGALAHMLEMEDYNELIKILRRVIDDQKDLDRKIRDRRKASLQDLLEDEP